MTTERIAALRQHRRVGMGALLLAATFAAGLASGSSLPSAAASGPTARAGSPLGTASSVACIASQVLDTSKPYLTIQHGVIVPGR